MDWDADWGADPPEKPKCARDSQSAPARWGRKVQSCSGSFSDPGLLTLEDERLHVEGCADPRSCHRCIYLRNQESWQHAASLVKDGKKLGTWLLPVIAEDERWGLSCFVCQQQAKMSEWARGTIRTCSLGNVRRHGQCDQHQEALRECGYDCKEIARDLAPSIEKFQKVLQHRQSGRPLRDSLEGMGTYKLEKMQWCLAESVRDATRDFLGKACSIALMMDTRKSLCVVRYSATDAQLDSRKGLLGYRYIRERETATAIVKTVRGTLEDLCTCGDDGEFQESLFKRIVSHVELICADAASNEQVAGRVTRVDLCPNARIVHRDSTHALTRVLKRPWAAIGPIADVLDQWVTGSDSVTQMIENSTTLSSVYQGYCRGLDNCEVNTGRMKDLRATKNRFASYQRPLSRAVLTWDAILSTLIWMETNRDGAERARLRQLLSDLDEEKLVMMAMLADVADENIRVIRFVDCEQYDLSELPEELSCLLDRLHFLINQGGILQQGYTAYMLNYLKGQRGFLIGSGQAKTIGGEGAVDAPMLLRCVELLKTCLALVIATVNSEFPHFEALRAFAVFNVREKRNSAMSEHTAWTQRRLSSIARLAKFCEVPEEHLLQQFIDLEPMARHEAASSGCASFDAWRKVILRANTRKATRDKHPSEALTAVLVKYGTWCGITSSGVEQNFSLLSRFQTPERRHMLESTAADEAMLLLLTDKSSIGALCQAARNRWIGLFNPPRASSNNRLDKGVPRKADPNSEQSFIKRRRAEVDAQAMPTAEQEVSRCAAVGAYTDQRVSDELSWQRSQGYKHKLQSYLTGALLESEVDQELVQAAMAMKTRQEQLDKARPKRERALEEMLRPKVMDVQRQHFYVEDATWAQLQDIDASKCTQDVQDADAFVLRNPGDPDESVLWAVTLKGGILCNLEYARKRGKSGVAFHFSAAVSVKRELYISDRFRGESPFLSRLLLHSARLPGSKWSTVSDLEEFVDRSLLCRRQKKRFQCIGLFAQSEAAKIQGEANMFTKADFLKFASKMSVAMRGTSCT
ncbi:unnamed protein product [Symbiodinium sp. CCMP2592]|nr:unnamed protein product [Symbiodinium sp. CCMP2592]